MHSFDIPALVENLEAQAMTVESARPICWKSAFGDQSGDAATAVQRCGDGPRTPAAARNAALCSRSATNARSSVLGGRLEV